MASSANLRIAGLLVLGLTPVALVAACSSSSNPSPETPVYTTTGDDGGDATTTTQPTEAGSGSDGSARATDAGGSPDVASDAAPTCTSALSDAGCYVCPGTSVQFLNQCSATGVQCAGFNNLSRLPGYDGGALAPLK